MAAGIPIRRVPSQVCKPRLHPWRTNFPICLNVTRPNCLCNMLMTVIYPLSLSNNGYTPHLHLNQSTHRHGWHRARERVVSPTWALFGNNKLNLGSHARCLYSRLYFNRLLLTGYGPTPLFNAQCSLVTGHLLIVLGRGIGPFVPRARRLSTIRDSCQGCRQLLWVT